MNPEFRKSVNWSEPTQSYFKEDNESPAKREPKEEGGKAPTPLQCLKIERGTIGLIIGQQKSGKTNLLRQIVAQNAKDYHVIHLLCPTADSPTDPNDYSWLADRFICTEPSIQKVDELIEFQKNHPSSHMLLILDDCQSAEGFDVKGKFWKRLGSISRKFRMTILVLQQNLPGMESNFRDNARYVFVMNCRGNTMPILAGITGEAKGTITAIIEAAHKKDPWACCRFNLYAGPDKYWVFSPGKAPVFYVRCGNA